MTAAQHTEQSAARMPLHPVEPDRFRAVMGHFATGVAVVTATGPEGPVGMTANAVCSLSLDPLLALVCFDQRARARSAWCATPSASASTCWRPARRRSRAASRPRSCAEAEKFTGVAHTIHDGIPVLADGLAWVGCELTDLVPGGDHVIGIGRVVAAETGGAHATRWCGSAARYGAFGT